MAVTTTNLISGPGELYAAAFGTAEPADSVVGTAPIVAPPSFTDVGGTNDGVNLIIGQEFFELEVDQIIERAGSRQTKRTFDIQTNLAEATLANLAMSINSTAGVTVSGTGATTITTLDPDTTTSVQQPTYKALIFDGWAPDSKRRRVIARKMLSNDNVELAYKKGEMSVLAVTWAGHFVSSSIKPFHIVDHTPA